MSKQTFEERAKELLALRGELAGIPGPIYVNSFKNPTQEMIELIADANPNARRKDVRKYFWALIRIERIKERRRQ